MLSTWQTCLLLTEFQVRSVSCGPSRKSAFESNIKGHENKGGDDQLKKLSIVKQILLVTYLGKCVDKSRENISTDVRMLRVELDNR